MSLYYLLLDAVVFHEQIRPALSASWRQRSFEPCRPLSRHLAATAIAPWARYQTGLEEPLVSQLDKELAFDRDVWRYLVGEILWLSAREIPDLQTTPEALCRLLGTTVPQPPFERPQLAPVQQVYFGSRDLVFDSAYYRPDAIGYNDLDDVGRLAVYLKTIDPGPWTSECLASLPGLTAMEDREEELEMVKEWLPPLMELYAKAQQEREIVICEQLVT
jgi:hypothetical protein